MSHGAARRFTRRHTAVRVNFFPGLGEGGAPPPLRPDPTDLAELADQADRADLLGLLDLTDQADRIDLLDRLDLLDPIT